MCDIYRSMDATLDRLIIAFINGHAISLFIVINNIV